MPSYIALLRGINVGKAKRIAMADLRDVFLQLGMTSVKTLLQSGNVAFESASVPDPQKIEAAVQNRSGVQSTVLIIEAIRFRAVASADPMLEVADNPSRHVIVFLDRHLESVTLPDAAALDPERISQGEYAFYQWLPEGVLATKVPNTFWKRVETAGAVTTARNRRTVDKLLTILDDMPGG